MMKNAINFFSSLVENDRVKISRIIRESDLSVIASNLSEIVSDRQKYLKADPEYRRAVTFAIEYALMLNLEKRNSSTKEVPPLFNADFYPKLNSRDYQLHG